MLNYWCLETTPKVLNRPGEVSHTTSDRARRDRPEADADAQLSNGRAHVAHARHLVHARVHAAVRRRPRPGHNRVRLCELPEHVACAPQLGRAVAILARHAIATH